VTIRSAPDHVSFFGQIALQNLQMTKPFKPVLGIGVGAQFQWDIIKDRFAIAAQGTAVSESRRLKNDDEE
jgi:hypothetical protein